MTVLLGLDARIKMARLYLITDGRRRENDFGTFVDAAFAGGVDVLELRRGDMTEAEELEQLELARTIAYHYQGLVVVSEHTDVASRFQADALHLGAAAGPSREAREKLSEHALVGRSAHDDAELRYAQEDAATNFALLGPVHQPADATYRTTGLDLVRNAAEHFPAHTAKPWFVWGGVNTENIAEVLRLGARRVAVGSAIRDAADPRGAARDLKEALNAAWSGDAAMTKYQHDIYGDPKASFKTDEQRGRQA